MALKKAELRERFEINGRLFLEVSCEINSSTHSKLILNGMTRKTCEDLDLKGETIELVDQENGGLEVAFGYGLSSQFLQNYLGQPNQAQEKALSGVAEFVR